MNGSIKPYYEEDGIVLYNNDCREVLPQFPDKSFDLCLTDPPYGHGDKWSGGTWASNPIYEDAFSWDAQTVDMEVILSLFRFAAGQILWGGNYYSLPPSRCWLAWEKSSKMDTLADFELAWTNFDHPSKRFLEDRNPDGKRYHPTQKPLSLFKWCLGFAPNAKTILDPFCGSGTTLVAAKQLGRKAVGIEISEKYCKIAVDRLRQKELFGSR
jgi:site-specific DNA-methyltransferase (adenine-specific)